MNHLKILILFLSVLIFIFHISCRQNTNTDVTSKIIMSNGHLLGSTDQLIVVYNDKPEDHKAVLVALEKRPKGWRKVLEPISAGVGRHGFAKPGKKVEGDGKSPTGLFTLGHLFSYEKVVETKMPYSQTTNQDKWIDDPESEDYNRHVRGETKAKSYENLMLNNDLYKFCMVIEYNTNPVIKGKGSAIFFHLSEDPPGATAGCVAIPEDNMVWILKWMNPELNPSIIMGNKQDLIAGLK